VAGADVAAAQVCQDEESLPTAGQATPPGTGPTTVTGEKAGEVLQGRSFLHARRRRYRPTTRQVENGFVTPIREL
jgi:hypothetical protein